MQGDIVDLDHLMFNCFDAERTRLLFQKLGFTVRGFRPIEPMGGGASGGRGGSLVVLFDSGCDNCANYLELSVCDNQFAHPAMRTILTGAQGVAMAVHATLDAQSVFDRWIQLGIPVEDWAITMRSAGPGIPASDVRIVMPHGGPFPLPINAVEAADLSSWKDPGLQEHANGALRFKWLLFGTTPKDFSQSVDSMAKAYGFKPKVREEDFASFEPGKTHFRLMARDRLEREWPRVSDPVGVRMPCAAIVGIEVDDISKIQRVLDASCIEWTKIGNQVCTSPADTLNTVFAFEEQA